MQEAGGRRQYAGGRMTGCRRQDAQEAGDRRQDDRRQDDRRQERMQETGSRRQEAG